MAGMADRPMPPWLRIIINLVAFVGVLATVMGWISLALGGLITAVAIIYFLWEIDPWVTKQIATKPVLSLIAFALAGAALGTVVWSLWRSRTRPVPISPSMQWNTPLPITHGTALSTTQLDATANVPGTFSYSPDVGAILPAGTHSLAAHFAPSDSSKYRSADATVTLAVNPPPPPNPPPNAKGASSENKRPSPNSVRSYVAYIGMPVFAGSSPTDTEGSAFSVGDPLGFNIHFKATGANPVTLLDSAFDTEVVTGAIAEDGSYQQKVTDGAAMAFLSELRKERAVHKFPFPSHTMMPGDTEFNTAYAWTDGYSKHRIVTQGDLDAVKTGSQTWVVMSVLTYSDGETVHPSAQMRMACSA
jgi:hypothetical protein